MDLLVGDVYPTGGAPLPPQATAANFGKLASTRREDLARALIGLVGENVGLLCGELSRTHGVECVVYAGSTLTDNPQLQQILGLVASLQGRVAHFLSDAPFCGAVGAAALADA